MEAASDPNKKKWTYRASWLIPTLLFAWLLGQRLPLWWSHWHMEGTSVDVFTVLDQEGKKIDFPPGPAQKRVVIFWASWCAPCKIELQRYQSSLDSGSLPPGSVQTVAIWDEPATVKSFIQSKGYTFPVYFSSDPNILKAYQVQATPTVALLDEANNIYWVSSGISPLGIYRAENFINDSK